MIDDIEEIKIVLVEDQTIEAMNIKKSLESFNYQVPYIASNGPEAIEKIHKIHPDLVLMDVVLQGEMNGIDVATKIKHLDIPVIFITAYTDESIIKKATATQPYGFIVKPYNDTELKFAIRMAVYKKNVKDELRWSEDRLKMGMDIAKLVYWEYDTENDLFTFDDQFYTLYGTTAAEQGGYHMSSADYANRFIPLEEQALVGVEVAKALETEDPHYSSTLSHSIIRADGEKRHILVRIRIRTNENGEKIGTKGVNQDITEQEKAKEALKEADQQLFDIINFLPDATFIIDDKGRVISWNRAIYEMTQINPEDILGKGNQEYALIFYRKRQPMLLDMVNASDHEISEIYPDFQRKGKILTAETKLYIKGEPRTAWAKAVPLEDSKGNYLGAIEAIRDITDLKKTEKKLKKSLEEKEILLKEIHHRVKNNLTIISSLLNLQSEYIEDQEALDVFIESQNRAKTMALIHERLYQSKDLKNIDFGEYIRTLSNELYHTMISDTNQIKLDLKVEDVKIDINTVVPLGLIVNELVTNCMKYAFPDNRSGKISIKLYRKDYDIILKISDDGIGLPENIDIENTNSLGLQLVNSLTMQIDGRIELERSPGTTFTLIFKE
ncbi:MAG: response regulator [Methanobacterium sp.]|nr:response regulator [Methanobacterium sp.]